MVSMLLNPLVGSPDPRGQRACVESPKRAHSQHWASVDKGQGSSEGGASSIVMHGVHGCAG